MLLGLRLGLLYWGRNVRLSIDGVLSDRKWAGISGLVAITTLAIAILPVDPPRVAAVDAPTVDTVVAEPATLNVNRDATTPVDPDATTSVDPAVTTPAAAADHAFGDRPFAITDPLPDAALTREPIIVRGVGGIPGGQVSIDVFTNDVYPQKTCSIRSHDEGKWSCGPVYLRGQGHYRLHTIIAKLIVNGEVVSEARVSGVRLATAAPGE
jgi:hypothetical protein